MPTILLELAPYAGRAVMFLGGAWVVDKIFGTADQTLKDANDLGKTAMIGGALFVGYHIAKKAKVL